MRVLGDVSHTSHSSSRLQSLFRFNFTPFGLIALYERCVYRREAMSMANQGKPSYTPVCKNFQPVTPLVERAQAVRLQGFRGAGATATHVPYAE